MTTCRMPSIVAACAIITTNAGRASSQQSPATAAGPPDIVRPGDPQVTARHIAPHTNHWRMTYLAPDGHAVPGGPKRPVSWYDTVSTERWNGRVTLHRRQVLLGPANDVLEIIDNWIDPKTFAPLQTENHHPLNGAAWVRHYDGKHVSGFDPDSTTADAKRPVDVTLSESVFDFFGGTYDLLLSGFPLHGGYRVRFPADFGGAKAGASLEWVTVTVTGKDIIDTGGPLGKVSTWHVETGRTPMGRFEFWLSAKAPYMIRMWYIGPLGGKQIWDVAS